MLDVVSGCLVVCGDAVQTLTREIQGAARILISMFVELRQLDKRLRNFREGLLEIFENLEQRFAFALLSIGSQGGSVSFRSDGWRHGQLHGALE